MAFAQRDYPQLLGNSTTETISEAGCFLTSFCNLLDRWGKAIDPPSLNEFFKHNGKFIGADDLAWSSITAYDGNVVVRDVGAVSTPDSNDSIVEFRYNSVHTGKLITHFCLVDHIEGSQVFIVDSWDGSIKGPNAYQSVYHTHIAWASYIKKAPAPVNPIQSYEPKTLVTLRTKLLPTTWWNLNGTTTDINSFHPATLLDIHTPFPVGGVAHHINGYQYAMVPEDFNRAQNGDFSNNNGVNLLDLEEIPAPPPPPPTPPAAPLAYTPTEKYTLLADVPGYTTAADALKQQKVALKIPAGTYTVYGDKTYSMMPLLVDATTNPKIVLWVNPTQNVKQEIKEVINVPVPEPVKVTVAAPSLPPAPVNTNLWKTTYKPFHPNAPLIPVKYVAIQDFVMRDLSGHRPDLHIPEDKEFGLYGVFTYTDGRKYFRAKTNGDVNFDYYYAVPTQHPDGGIGYVVPSGILEIFPKPVQHGFVSMMGTAERVIDGVFNRINNRKVRK